MDWPKLITDLEEAGLTQTEIAAACETSQSYISQLKTGDRKEPGFSIGDAIRDLHRKENQKRNRRETRPA